MTAPPNIETIFTSNGKSKLSRGSVVLCRNNHHERGFLDCINIIYLVVIELDEEEELGEGITTGMLVNPE
jgi:hypothetical protein